jgi:hypothetical protein
MCITGGVDTGSKWKKSLIRKVLIGTATKHSITQRLCYLT